jgi:ATP-dependent helicase/nuclease subunit A
LLADLDRAQISTIDSFCTRVIQENFHHLDLDPDATVMGEEQSPVLQREVLDETLERWYGNGSKEGNAFRELADLYGGKIGDEALRGALLKVHTFLESLHDPGSWLEVVESDYTDDSTRPDWLKQYGDLVRAELEQTRRELEDGVKRSRAAGLERYVEHAGDILAAVDRWLDDLRAEKESEALDRIAKYKVETLPRVSQGPEEERESAKTAINAGKNTLKELKKRFCAAPFQEMAASVAATASLARVFLRVVEDFRSSYARAKRERALLDFADLEQHAFRLLRHPESTPESPRPSEVAQAYRERYRYVLVDEYQDTSPIQDAILDLVSRSVARNATNNRFLVGDVKQCIYGFRHAEPTCFREKIKPGGERTAKDADVIYLQENFRSRREVIDGINDIFGEIMRVSLGGVDYSDKEALVFGRTDKAAARDPGPRIEFHLLERKLDVGESEAEEEEETEEASAAETWDIDAQRREALWVGRRIREMVGRREFDVYDPETEETRPVRFRDIAILLRATKVKARVYANEFQRSGVPVFADTRSGLFDAMEVRDLVSLLRVMENPRQDVPLTGLLRSILIGLSETDIARVRPAGPEWCCFWESLTAAASESENVEVRERSLEALDRIGEWRRRFGEERVSRVLEEILEETDYLPFIEGQVGGEQRRANVLHFLNLLRGAESGPGRGLSGVLSFLRGLEETEQDLGTAQALPASEDVVRLMSIHRSKGLEFPVVFVPDLGKRFNFEGAKGDILVHRDRGLGLRVIDLDAGIKYPTPIHRLMAHAIQKDDRSEEMRVLYVAFTRARERLVLSGGIDSTKVLSGWVKSGGKRLEPASLHRAMKPVDWLGPVIVNHADGEILRRIAGRGEIPSGVYPGKRFVLGVYPGTEMTALVEESATRASARGKESACSPSRLLAGESPEMDDDTRRAIERLEQEYRYEASTGYPSRIMTTSLERLPSGTPLEAEERTTFFPPWRESPRFLEDPDRVSPRERGGAVHKFLEFLDLGGSAPEGKTHEENLREAKLREQAQRMVKAGVLEADWVPLIPFNRLEWFFRETGPGRALRERAGEVLREVPFVLAVPGDSPLKETPPEGETALVRGVIDCLVPDGEGYLLIDYKTDRVTRAEIDERAGYYRPQMEVYREAVRKLFGKEVTGCFLVFLGPGVVKEIPGGGWRSDGMDRA